MDIIKNDRNGFFALNAAFFVSMVLVISGIYSNTLFLSFYPRTWLIYLLASQAIATVVFSFAFTSVLLRNIKQNTQIIFGCFAVIFGVFISLQNVNFYWLPFISAVFTGAMGSLCAVIIFNVIPLGFGIRDYKLIARYAGRASVIGLILGSFIIPLLLVKFSLESLLYFSILCLIVAQLSIHYLQLLKEPAKQKKFQAKESVWEYPLFKKILWLIILTLFIQLLIEYVFKLEAAQHYTEKNLANFFGYYSAATNILALIIDLTITKYVLKRYRIDGLLYLTQMLALTGCVLAIIKPSLWTIALLNAVKNYNYIGFAAEVMLNVLPSAVRITGEFQIKMMIKPVMTVGIYCILLFFVHWVSTTQIVIFTACMLLLVIFLIKQSINKYKKTLEQEAEFNRFTLLDKVTSSNAAFFKTIAYHALQSNNSEITLLGLMLLEKTGAQKKLPTSVYAQLKVSDYLLKKKTIELIKESGDKEALTPLQIQFSVEKNPEIQFLLLDAIARIDVKCALAIARKQLDDPSENSPALLNILFHYGQPSEIYFAKKTLHTLVHSSDTIVKKQTAQTIHDSNDEAFEPDLNILITDRDDNVSEIAINAAANTKRISLLPKILKKLKSPKIMHATKTALTAWGVATLPFIQEEISHTKNPATLIKLLANIPGIEAEEALLSLIPKSNIFVRTLIAREANNRARHQNVSKAFKQAAKQLILEESQLIHFLNDLLQDHPEKNIFFEINSRIFLAKQRILFWLAVTTESAIINKLLPALLKPAATFAFQQVQEKALELLEIYIHDDLVAREVLAIFDLKQKEKVQDTDLKKPPITDDWLIRVIQLQTNPTEEKDMNNILNVFDLRQVELFSSLPSETLLAIGEETKRVSFNEGEIIFNENDSPDGLYCISSGEVTITRQSVIINTLHEHDYFGELALIDDSVRTATAIAKTDCSLLFLEKSTFDRITDDLPEILRVVTRVILGYLRQNLK